MNFIKTLQNHRSIRKYTTEEVADEVLEEILEAGIRASSSGNMNTYSIIVTKNKKLRKKLYYPHMKQSMVIDAPILITFCADFHRMQQWLRLSDAPDGFDNYMSFMVSAIDAILVSQNVALAAESKGLGICYLGSTLANCDQIGKILELPKSVVPVAGFTLGYPAEDPEPRDRLPLHGVVHFETYKKYSDESIKEIYKDRDAYGWNRYMNIARLRKMVEKNGVENLAQIYSKVKYTQEANQKFSNTILNYLEKQGFMNN